VNLQLCLEFENRIVTTCPLRRRNRGGTDDDGGRPLPTFVSPSPHLPPPPHPQKSKAAPRLIKRAPAGPGRIDPAAPPPARSLARPWSSSHSHALAVWPPATQRPIPTRGRDQSRVPTNERAHGRSGCVRCAALRCARFPRNVTRAAEDQGEAAMKQRQLRQQLPPTSPGPRR